MIAADRSAVHGKCGGRVALRANPHSFSFCTGRVSDRAAVFTVTKYELRVIGDIDDLAVRIGGACYGACQAVSIQTEIERAACFYYKAIVSCRITCQIDIGGLGIRIVCNLVCSIPRGPCDSFARPRMVADILMVRAANGVIRMLRRAGADAHQAHRRAQAQRRAQQSFPKSHDQHAPLQGSFGLRGPEGCGADPHHNVFCSPAELDSGMGSFIMII